jgi:hypothetical protein
MKQLGISVTILLFFGIWITGGLVSASELTADQQVQPSTAAVGETAMVTLMLSYSGNNGTQVTVTPGVPPGIMADSGPQTDLLSPGSQQMISYPIRAERSGSYWITSLISYTDDGALRQLSKESPFTASGGPTQPEQQPGSAPSPSLPAPVMPAPVHVDPTPIDNSPNDNGPTPIGNGPSDNGPTPIGNGPSDNGPVPSEHSPAPSEPVLPPVNEPVPSGNASL